MFIGVVKRESPITCAGRARIEEMYAEMSSQGLSSEDVTERLMLPFEFFIKYLSRRFFLPGAEASDVRQEALLGLSHAVLTFDGSKGASFFDYATMCMRNKVLAAVRKANRNKQKILSESVRIEALKRDPMSSITPCRIVTTRLMVESLLGWIDRGMSPLEARTLRNWMGGTGVSELSERWDIEPKKVENALFRARRKAKAFLESGSEAGMAA